MGVALNQVSGNYEFLGVIGKPRAGVTYKVRNLSTGEFEALTALPGSASRDSESAERLLREIRVLARLSHPNVAAFHDAFELDGCIVMTADLLEGPTLAELCGGGPLAPRRAAEILTQIFGALEDAHALGIVHRGITAEHVAVAADGAVKLGGFDLAKPASDVNLTQAGATIGDPRYISPEQVAGRPLDGRSDLYSAGVLLYQLLAGKLPFEAASEFDLLSAHLSAEPQPPSAVNPSVAPELDRIVLRALKKNPGERFQTAREFQQALEAPERAPAPSKPVDSAPLPSEMPVNRPKTRLVYLGAAILIAVAAITWLIMH